LARCTPPFVGYLAGAVRAPTGIRIVLRIDPDAASDEELTHRRASICTAGTILDGLRKPLNING